MYEMDVCYKIIFEAMVGESVLQTVAEKLDEYTKAGILFVSGSGRILACSCANEKFDLESIRRNHLTLGDYENVQAEVMRSGCYRYVELVKTERKVCGHISILYEDEKEKDFFAKLAGVLAKTLKPYFEEEWKSCLVSQSLKANVTGWTIFEGTKQEARALSEQLEGMYLVGYLAKEQMDRERMQEFAKIWRELYFYETEQAVLVLFYKLKEEDAEKILSRIEAGKYRFSASEVFTRLELCQNKKNLLARMAKIASLPGESFVRCEKEWAVQGWYTYTIPLIKEAGLQDYAITKLQQKDQENHTELYETLRLYLLCENNVTMAAKQLHIHRNTMVYRLKQIKDIIEVDVNDNEKARELLAYIMMHDRMM